MPRSLRKSTRPRVCRRLFEPGRLRDQMLSEAYQQLVSGSRGVLAGVEPPTPGRSGRRGSSTPVSVPSCGGICA